MDSPCSTIAVSQGKDNRRASEEGTVERKSARQLAITQRCRQEGHCSGQPHKVLPPGLFVPENDASRENRLSLADPRLIQIPQREVNLSLRSKQPIFSCQKFTKQKHSRRKRKKKKKPR